jgi:hypothetical protein
MASRSLGERLLRPSTFTRIPQSSRQTTPSWTCQRTISRSPRQPAQPQRKQADQNYVPERAAASPQPTQSETSQTIDSMLGGTTTNRAPYMRLWRSLRGHPEQTACPQARPEFRRHGIVRRHSQPKSCQQAFRCGIARCTTGRDVFSVPTLEPRIRTYCRVGS